MTLFHVSSKSLLFVPAGCPLSPTPSFLLLPFPFSFKFLPICLSLFVAHRTALAFTVFAHTVTVETDTYNDSAEVFMAGINAYMDSEDRHIHGH